MTRETKLVAVASDERLATFALTLHELIGRQIETLESYEILGVLGAKIAHFFSHAKKCGRIPADATLEDWVFNGIRINVADVEDVGKPGSKVRH